MGDGAVECGDRVEIGVMHSPTRIIGSGRRQFNRDKQDSQDNCANIGHVFILFILCIPVNKDWILLKGIDNFKIRSIRSEKRAAKGEYDVAGT
jgi:hypothetical protein